MTEEVKQEILDLYFNKFYSFSRIEEHFKDKYTYAQIKSVIMNALRGETV